MSERSQTQNFVLYDSICVKFKNKQTVYGSRNGKSCYLVSLAQGRPLG